MTLKGFIEKAIEGGWNDGQDLVPEYYNPINDSCKAIFLDPLAWQAVGKVEGWGNTKDVRLSYVGFCRDEECNTDNSLDEAYRIDFATYQIHRMIDALAEGKTIEEFLKTI